MKRVYMTFYREWYEAVSGLPEALRSEVLIAMIEYGLNGKVKGEMSPTAMVFFNMVKGKIDTNNKRYENGMKGGRPKTKTKPNHNQTETKQKPNHNQTETKQKPNHNQTETKTKPNHNQTETEIRMGENAENVQNSSANRICEGFN